MRQGVGLEERSGWEPTIGIQSGPPEIDFSYFKVPIQAATSWLPNAVYHVEVDEAETTWTNHVSIGEASSSPQGRSTEVRPSSGW